MLYYAPGFLPSFTTKPELRICFLLVHKFIQGLIFFISAFIIVFNRKIVLSREPEERESNQGDHFINSINV